MSTKAKVDTIMGTIMVLLVGTLVVALVFGVKGAVDVSNSQREDKAACKALKGTVLFDKSDERAKVVCVKTPERITLP